MKKTAEILSVLMLIAASAANAGAQNLKTSYFTEGYSYRYRLNPAFTSTMDFAMAGIGSINMGVESNLSFGDFLPMGESGKTSLFLAGPVYGDGLTKHMRDVNKADVELNESIAACGFWTGNLFHTVELNARSSANMYVPRSFLESFLGKYDSPINFKMSARSMTELAYGISVPVVDGLRLGARAKFLIGVDNIDINASNVTMVQNGSTYDVTGDVKINGYIPPVVYFPTKGEIAEKEGTPISPEYAPRVKFSEAEWGKQEGYAHFLPGFGLSFDLGASYDFCDYFTASFAVTDLGFMCWRNHSSYTSPESWQFAGYQHIDESLSLKDQWDAFTDDFDECFPVLKDEAGSDKLTTFLRATLNAGFEFRMPFYERWSVGLFGTGKVGQKDFGYAEGRFVTTVTPIDWFSFATSYAYSSFGHSWGTFFNFKTTGINFFFGTDSLVPIFKFEGSVPANRSILNCTAGLTIAFGEKHDLR